MSGERERVLQVYRDALKALSDGNDWVCVGDSSEIVLDVRIARENQGEFVRLLGELVAQIALDAAPPCAVARAKLSRFYTSPANDAR